MMANMAASLILHKRISTTTAKAKALRTYVEPLITKSKEDSTHSRRMVFGFLQNKEAVAELFREVSPKISDRPGGYTRILKTGTRLGDNADMCIIELVDFNTNLLAAKEEAASKSGRRRRRSPKKKEVAGQDVTAETVETEALTETETEAGTVTEKPKTKKAPAKADNQTSGNIEAEIPSAASEMTKSEEEEESKEEKKEE